MASPRCRLETLLSNKRHEHVTACDVTVRFFSRLLTVFLFSESVMNMERTASEALVGSGGVAAKEQENFLLSLLLRFRVGFQPSRHSF